MTQDPNIEDRARQDEWLVVRCQLGERPVFDALIERWYAPLWRYVRQLTSNDVAQEIAQEVPLTLFYLPNYRLCRYRRSKASLTQMERMLYICREPAAGPVKTTE